MTPIQHPVDEAEERYNIALKQTRHCIERSFGLLKQRFRCLHKDGGNLTFEPGKCCKIVVACMMLHNMCVTAQLPLEMCEDDDNDENNDEGNDGDEENVNNDGADLLHRGVQGGAVQIRRNLAHERFGRP